MGKKEEVVVEEEVQTSTTTDLVDYEAMLAKEAEEVDDSIGSSESVKISVDGKKFTFPDGHVVNAPFSFIILDWRNVNLYYTKQYKKGEYSPPTCGAIGKDKHDQLAPQSDANEVQHDNCTDCPMQQWGSDPQGGRGKACKNRVKLAVVLPDAGENADIYTMEVSPTAIKGWNSYVKRIKNDLKTLPVAVITELDFHAHETYPTLIFPKTTPKHTNLGIMMKLRERAQAILDEPIPFD